MKLCGPGTVQTGGMDTSNIRPACKKCPADQFPLGPIHYTHGYSGQFMLIESVNKTAVLPGNN